MRRYIRILGIASAILVLAFVLLGIAGLALIRYPRLRVLSDRIEGFGARDSDLEKLDDNKWKKSISDVRIQSNDITDQGVEHLAVLSNVRLLSLDGPKLSDRAFTSIAKMKNLESLSISNAYRLSDQSFASIAKMTNLDSLRISNANITNQGLKLLAGHPNLRELHLEGTHVSDDGFNSIVGSWPRLETLSVNGHDITDEVVPGILECKKLKYLGLSGTRITNLGLVDLAQLPNLELVDVSDTQVTDSGVAIFSGLRPKVHVSGPKWVSSD